MTWPWLVYPACVILVAVDLVLHAAERRRRKRRPSRSRPEAVSGPNPRHYVEPKRWVV